MPVGAQLVARPSRRATMAGAQIPCYDSTGALIAFALTLFMNHELRDTRKPTRALGSARARVANPVARWR